MDNLPTPEFMLSLVQKSFRKSMGDFSYEAFISRLWRELDEVGAPGIVRVPEQDRWAHSGQIYNYDGSSYELKAAAVEAYFKIVQSGFVVEQPTQQFFERTRPSGQWFRWTARGQAWIDDTQPVPEHPSAYMDYLRGLVSRLDPVVEQYVSEALVAFDRGADFAAAVMVGAACEKFLYLLTEAMLPALQSPTEKMKLEKLFQNRKLTGDRRFLERENCELKSDSIPNQGGVRRLLERDGRGDSPTEKRCCAPNECEGFA